MRTSLQHVSRFSNILLQNLCLSDRESALSFSSRLYLSYCLCLSLFSYYSFDLRQNRTHRPHSISSFPVHSCRIRTTIDFSFFFFRSFQRRKNANDLSPPPPSTKKRDVARNVRKTEEYDSVLTEPFQRRIIRITRSCSPSTLPRSNNKSTRGFRSAVNQALTEISFQ